MWVKLDEKHKHGLWLARNKYEKEPFKVAYRLVDEEENISVFTLFHHPHIFVNVQEIWEEE